MIIDMNQYKDTFQSKMYLDEYFKVKLNEIQGEKAPEEYLESLYSCFILIKNVSKPIKYDEIAKQDDSHYYIKNVLVLGNIGNGKSTTLNKLATYLLLGGKNHKQMKKEFKAESSNTSVTTEVLAKIFCKLRLVDTPGFGDPSAPQAQHWNKVLNDIQKSAK